MKKEDKFILRFDELSIEDVPLVGGKNASLGEMYRELGKKGVKVPNGFAITATAYRYFIETCKYFIQFGFRDFGDILQDFRLICRI